MTPKGGRPAGPGKILLLCKPPGMTSHDVVRICRRRLGIRSIGHAGTLDPAAAGLLVLCVGRATRLSEYLMEPEKEYWAEAGFGAETDTYDADGRVVRRQAVGGLSRGRVEAALQELQGELLQSPPPYSAVKQGGVPAYRRARRGEKVDLPPRRVTVQRLELIEVEEGPEPLARFRVVCSKGTYIRSLVHELGRRLGCGAYLRFLVRTRSGRLHLADAALLEEVTGTADGRGWLEPAAVLSHWPRLVLAERAAAAVENGSQAALDRLAPAMDRAAAPGSAAAGETAAAGGGEGRTRICLLDESGRLLAVACRQEGGWRLDKVFPRAPDA